MLSKRLSSLRPYAPGEQPSDRQYIKLNANENPYPPSPEVAKAVSRALAEHPERLGLYPDPDVDELRAAIARMLNQTGGSFAHPELNRLDFEVTPEMIFCGNGSDEVLSFVFYACFDSDRPLVLPEHTYSFYPVYCGFYGIPMLKIPLNPDWSLDTQKMLSEARDNGSPIIFANPNAPTGLALSREEVRRLLLDAPEGRCVIVDEAYCDFGRESCIPLLAEFKNLVIVRTFSKSLSFAGMRLGYVVASPEFVRAILTVKNSFNHFPVDFLAKTAAVAAASDTAYYADCTKKIVAERGRLTQFLRGCGWDVLDSQTNFVFCRNPNIGGREIYAKIKADGILVRRFDTPGIEQHLRITIGTAGQMDALMASIERNGL